MSTMKRYLRGISEKFGHLATWFPDEKLNLGDVGLLQRGRFFLKTTLKALHIPFTTRTGNVGGDWDHSSGSDVSVDFQGAAQVSTPGAPGGHAVVSFGSSGAFLFQAMSCLTETIEDMADVGNQILLAYRAGDYQKDWVVIDRLVTAASATVLLSESKRARVELGAKTPLTSLPSLADASLGVKVERWEGEVTRYVARETLSPMFGASRLGGGIFGAKQVEPVRSEANRPAAPSPPASALVTVAIDDQLSDL